MSIFKKIKQMLGIGTLSVKLQVPGSANASDGVVKGSILITAKSDQSVKEIEVKLEEEVTTGRGDDAESKEYTLGTWRDNSLFEMKEGETKTVEFELPFEMKADSIDDLAAKGGALGGLGKMAKFANNKKSKYTVEAMVDVVGAKLDPNDIADINIITGQA